MKNLGIIKFISFFIVALVLLLVFCLVGCFGKSNDRVFPEISSEVISSDESSSFDQDGYESMLQEYFGDMSEIILPEVPFD